MESGPGQAQQQQEPLVQEEPGRARVGSNAAPGSASTGAPAEASSPPQTRSSAECFRLQLQRRAASAHAATGAPGDAPDGASPPPLLSSNAECLLLQLQRRHASASSNGSWPSPRGDSRVELLPRGPFPVYLGSTGPDRSGATAAAHQKGKGKTWRIPLTTIFSSETYGGCLPPNPAFAAASGAGPSGIRKDEAEPPQQGEWPQPHARKTTWSKFKGRLKKIFDTKGAIGKPHMDHQAISTANTIEHYGEGDCFYRSFIFSYLEQVLDRQDTVEEERLFDAVKRVAMRHAQLGWTSEFSKGHKEMHNCLTVVACHRSFLHPVYLKNY